MGCLRKSFDIRSQQTCRPLTVLDRSSRCPRGGLGPVSRTAGRRGSCIYTARDLSTKRLDVQTAQVLTHKTATYTVNVGDVLNLNNQECVTQLNQLTEEMPIAYIRVFGVSKVRTDPIFSTVVTSEKNLMSAFTRYSQ